MGRTLVLSRKVYKFQHAPFMENPDQKLLEILRNEKFHRVFRPRTRRRKRRSGNRRALQGGDAPPSQGHRLHFADFHIRHPERGTFALAKRIMSRLTAEAFKKAIPSVNAITSVPATLRSGDNYVHQIDVIFFVARPGRQGRRKQSRLRCPFVRRAQYRAAAVVGRKFVADPN